MPTATGRRNQRAVHAIDDAQTLQRGHRSFQAAFEEALRVGTGGGSPREIRVRRSREGDSYTWTIKY